MKKFADYVIKFRLVILLALIIATIFFCFPLKNLKVRTNFDDLLPQTHPYVIMHKKFSKLFGGANILTIMVSVREGDIFTGKTLKKIKYITEELTGVPGVDRFKVKSIASKKMHDPRYVEGGIKNPYLMWPEVPKNEEEMKRLKQSILASDVFYGGYVSFDAKTARIVADFFDDELDYRIVYRELERIRAEVEDENTIVSMVGHPMHLGIVANMVKMMNYIMAGSVLLMPVILFLVFRSVWATIMIPLSGIVSGIWGLGFMSLLGFNLDPLALVLPFLVSLMAFRHSLQLYNRYYEEFERTNDSLESVRIIIEKMFKPGLTSVITDAFGIAIIAITPVPMLQKIALVCAFWSLVTVVIGLIMTPILLSYVPISEGFKRHMDNRRHRDKDRKGWGNHFADWLGPWIVSKGRYYVVIAVLFVLGFSWYWSEKLIVGDAQVGSNLLWPASRYNIDSVRINRNFPVINPMTVVLGGAEHTAIQKIAALKDIENFSIYMEKNSGAVWVQNVIKPIKSVGKLFQEDDPVWKCLPADTMSSDYYFATATTQGDPGDMDMFVCPHNSRSNVILYFGDKRGPTINKAIDAAKEYIDKLAAPGEGVKWEMAGGVIGLEAAINEVVAQKQLITLLLALSGVFVFCTINFRSLKAGLILTIPLMISNFMAFAYMAMSEIGLTISTLPVSAVGIGLGVDFGIYLLARYEEEKSKDASVTIEHALKETIQTYSKSILNIALTLCLGLLLWLISGLKFQAQMGMMLALILFLNCLGAVFVVPVLVVLTKYKK